jgi:hypothetical protein
MNCVVRVGPRILQNCVGLSKGLKSEFWTTSDYPLGIESIFSSTFPDGIFSKQEYEQSITCD